MHWCDYGQLLRRIFALSRAHNVKKCTTSDEIVTEKRKNTRNTWIYGSKDSVGCNSGIVGCHIPIHNSIRFDARFNATRGGMSGVVLVDIGPSPLDIVASLPVTPPPVVKEEEEVDSMVVNVRNTFADIDRRVENRQH